MLYHRIIFSTKKENTVSGYTHNDPPPSNGEHVIKSLGVRTVEYRDIKESRVQMT